MDAKLINYINTQLNEVPSSLNNKLCSFRGVRFNKREEFELIRRRIDDYMQKESDERLFVLPGLSGVGKTTLLFQAYEYLLKQKDVSPADILYVSCDDMNALGDVNLKEVIDEYLGKVHNTTLALLDKQVFIFVDEAHYDKNWDLHAKLVYDKSCNVFMMLSGSSSLHLDFNADVTRRLKIHEIMPLNYTQHLRLKYDYTTSISDSLIEMLFEGDVEKAQNDELKVYRDLINIKGYNDTDWNTYFKYGAFCGVLDKKYITDMTEELWTVISKIITEDITPEYNLNKATQDRVYRVLVLIASQKPGQISQNKVAGNLSNSTSTINDIFTILEQTRVMFHYQAYGGSESQSRKSWKYYIATPSLKNGINKKFGHSIANENDYDGILLENLVASLLFNLRNKLSNNPNKIFNVFYDNSNGGVDFIVQKEFRNPIPLEVGLGRKSDRQVRKFMNKHHSPYGIIISNKTDRIVKDGDIIYIPPKTFSLI